MTAAKDDDKTKTLGPVEPVVQPQERATVDQVEDAGTIKVPADEVANAAARSLHGDRAVEEKYAQPDAVALVGGSTLIADPEGSNPSAGELR